jgi:hypothetical protein
LCPEESRVLLTGDILEVRVRLLAELRNICVGLGQSIVNCRVGLGVRLESVAEQSREEGGCKERDGVFGTGRLLQQWEERLEGFRVLDERLGEIGNI